MLRKVFAALALAVLSVACEKSTPPPPAAQVDPGAKPPPAPIPAAPTAMQASPDGGSSDAGSPAVH